MDIRLCGEEIQPGKDPWEVRFKLGRRKIDPVITINPTRKRIWIKANTGYLEGVYLENIPKDARNLRHGVVLIDQDWGDTLYFMGYRENWREDKYFEVAEFLRDCRKELPFK